MDFQHYICPKCRRVVKTPAEDVPLSCEEHSTTVKMVKVDGDPNWVEFRSSKGGETA